MFYVQKNKITQLFWIKDSISKELNLCNNCKMFHNNNKAAEKKQDSSTSRGFHIKFKNFTLNNNTKSQISLNTMLDTDSKSFPLVCSAMNSSCSDHLISLSKATTLRPFLGTPLSGSWGASGTWVIHKEFQRQSSSVPRGLLPGL